MDPHNPPRTPSPATTASDPALWVPPTPRYAPIDEPDNFPGMPKRQLRSSSHQSSHDKRQQHPYPRHLVTRTPAQQIVDRSQRRMANTDLKSLASLLLHGAHEPMKPSAMFFPLTPEQTPAARKKKQLDTIKRSTTTTTTTDTTTTHSQYNTQLDHPVHSSRVIFPPSTHAVGSGRSYKSFSHPRSTAHATLGASSSTAASHAQPNRDLPHSDGAHPVPSDQAHEHTPKLYTDSTLCRVSSPLRTASPKKRSSLQDSQHDASSFHIFNDIPGSSSSSTSSPKRRASSLFTSRLLRSAKKQPAATATGDFLSSLSAHEISNKIQHDGMFSTPATSGRDRVEYDNTGIPVGLLDDVEAEDEEFFKNHPHHAVDYSAVPGMWCVFRGKKVFRPFPEGESKWNKIAPRVLFPKADTRSLEEVCTPIVPRRTAKTPISDAPVLSPFSSPVMAAAVAAAASTTQTFHIPADSDDLLSSATAFPPLESSSSPKKRSRTNSLSSASLAALDWHAAGAETLTIKRRKMAPSPARHHRTAPAAVHAAAPDSEDEVTDYEDDAPVHVVTTPRRSASAGPAEGARPSPSRKAGSSPTLLGGSSSSTATHQHRLHATPTQIASSIKRKLDGSKRFFR